MYKLTYINIVLGLKKYFRGIRIVRKFTKVTVKRLVITDL